MVWAVGGLEIDAAAQCVAGPNIELPPVEFVEQRAGLAMADRPGAAMLQLPLPGRLIIGHLDDEDHVGRMVDQLARLKQRPRLGDATC